MIKIYYLLIILIIKLSDYCYGIKNLYSFSINNADTATVIGHNAIFSNPAGIGRIYSNKYIKKDIFFKIPNLILGIDTNNNEFLKLKNDIYNFLFTNYKTSKIENLDNPVWFKGGVYPSVLFNFNDNLSINIVGIGDLISNKQKNITKINQYLDLGMGFGIAISNPNKLLNIGMAIRPIYRLYSSKKININQDLYKIKNNIIDNLNYLYSIGVDFGIMYSFANLWYPTIGFSIINLPISCKENIFNTFSNKHQTLCGTLFYKNLKDSNSDNILEPSNIKLGFAITPRITKLYNMKLSFDLHNLHLKNEEKYYGVPDIELIDLMHIGLEFFYGNPFQESKYSIRFGISKNNYSFGGKLKLNKNIIELAGVFEKIESNINLKLLSGLSFVF
jgi:hypothetical protein